MYPYLNDAWTMPLFEHNEKFVWNDGGKLGLGLGNNEIFLDMTFWEREILPLEIYISLNIYQTVIEKRKKRRPLRKDYPTSSKYYICYWEKD